MAEIRITEDFSLKVSSDATYDLSAMSWSVAASGTLAILDGLDCADIPDETFDFPQPMPVR